MIIIEVGLACPLFMNGGHTAGLNHLNGSCPLLSLGSHRHNQTQGLVYCFCDA